MHLFFKDDPKRQDTNINMITCKYFYSYYIQPMKNIWPWVKLPFISNHFRHNSWFPLPYLILLNNSWRKFRFSFDLYFPQKKVLYVRNISIIFLYITITILVKYCLWKNTVSYSFSYVLVFKFKFSVPKSGKDSFFCFIYLKIG